MGKSLRFCATSLENVLSEVEGASLDNRERIWSTFLDIYNCLRSWGWQGGNSANTFRRKCKRFIELFLESPHDRVESVDGGLFTNKRFGGYFPEDITPYMHALCHHIPDLMERYEGNLMQFSCYALEKLNNYHQKWWFNSTSHGGGRRQVDDLDPTCIRGYVQILQKNLRMIFNNNPEIRPFDCPECTAAFKRLGWWKRHLLLEHPHTDLAMSMIDPSDGDDEMSD